MLKYKSSRINYYFYYLWSRWDSTKKFAYFHKIHYLYIMKTKECTCKCGKVFEKPINEYNRSFKFNRPLYCSRKCAARNNVKNFKDKANRIPPINNIKANPFLYYLRNCKRRDFDFNLDSEYLNSLWLKQGGICPYSGVKLLLNNHSKRNVDIRYTASLDRIDSNLGYIKGNVQFISMSINYMKHTMSHSDIIDFLNTISKFVSSFHEDWTISSPFNNGQDALDSP